jgi:hypothetical protein
MRIKLITQIDIAQNIYSLSLMGSAVPMDYVRCINCLKLISNASVIFKRQKEEIVVLFILSHTIASFYFYTQNPPFPLSSDPRKSKSA